ncbi:hypothetical protein BLA29_014079, partial [Euroglyphus maynei]
MNNSNKPRNKRYRCSKCNKKFRTRELCLYHIRMFHQNNCKSSSTNNLDNSSGNKTITTKKRSSNQRSTDDDGGDLPLNLQTVNDKQIDDNENNDDDQQSSSL